MYLDRCVTYVPGLYRLTCLALVKGASVARCARIAYVPLQVNLGVGQQPTISYAT